MDELQGGMRQPLKWDSNESMHDLSNKWPNFPHGFKLGLLGLEETGLVLVLLSWYFMFGCRFFCSISVHVPWHNNKTEHLCKGAVCVALCIHMYYLTTCISSYRALAYHRGKETVVHRPAVTLKCD